MPAQGAVFRFWVPLEEKQATARHAVKMIRLVTGAAIQSHSMSRWVFAELCFAHSSTRATRQASMGATGGAVHRAETSRTPA